jgi:hypothetical protein
MAEKKKVKEAGVSVPIELDFPASLISRYANHFIIRTGEQECTLSFFEVIPPTIVGEPEEVRERVKEIKSVRAECVARIIVAKDAVPSIIEAMQNHLEKGRTAKKAENEKD